jgi:1,4-alpha-glucan branching enzyme
MRVIIDGVYNHADADAPLAKIDYEYWFYRDNPDPPEMQWGPKFNYTFYDEKLKVFPARKYVLESIRDWVQHYHIDGIRFDATRAIKDFDVMREFTEMGFRMVDERKPFFTVAEHIPEDPAICGYPAGPMIAAWHDEFANQLQAIATRHERFGADPWDLDQLERLMNPATNGYGSGNHVVNYLVSHDKTRIIRQIAEESLTFGEAAFRRVKLATALLLTSPGLPMIWMGQEFGAPNPKSLEPQPIDWKLLENANNRDLQQFVSKITNFRRANPAVSTDNFQVLLKDKERSLFAYKRWTDAGGVAIVVANLRDQPSGDFSLPDGAMENGQWQEIVSGNQMNIDTGTLKSSLGPSEVKIYLKK